MTDRTPHTTARTTRQTRIIAHTVPAPEVRPVRDALALITLAALAVLLTLDVYLFVAGKTLAPAPFFVVAPLALAEFAGAWVYDALGHAGVTAILSVLAVLAVVRFARR